MLMVTLVLFGSVAYQRLPINLLPDISYPTLSVRTEFTGAAPEEVENLVTRRVEESVSVVNKVIRVSSRSRAGISDVTVEFEWGTQMDFASLDVREKLDRVRLPQEVQRPIILRYDPGLEPIMPSKLPRSPSSACRRSTSPLSRLSSMQRSRRTRTSSSRKGFCR